MRQLVIEYSLEGHKRGYNFTSPTQGFHDDVLKTVWRRAMPRGQGWGAAQFMGAHSLKSFLLADGRVALSDVIVTDMRDESGRGGIRRAVVGVMTAGEYLEVLTERLRGYPPRLVDASYRSLPGGHGDKQTIFSYPYSDTLSWQFVEVMLIRQALKMASGGMFRSGKIVPFTTLALDYRDEGLMVAIPEEKAQGVKGTTVVRLR
jgi:hypothetical protein